ncbi:MAG: hypothetical protein KIS67_23400 [Verrucomicrobiae bacterium]|nr:hypothetical protein [Verrucomicrobiae bacterium]
MSITKMDKARRVTDVILATRASPSGKLLPTDTFAQGSYVRWTKRLFGASPKLAEQRVYFDIPGSGEGVRGQLQRRNLRVRQPAAADTDRQSRGHDHAVCVPDDRLDQGDVGGDG